MLLQNLSLIFPFVSPNKNGPDRWFRLITLKLVFVVPMISGRQHFLPVSFSGINSFFT